MPQHRIKKSSTTTMHISSGNTPNTAGIGVDSSTSEYKVKMSLDNSTEATKSNFRTMFDSHVGAAGEATSATSYGIASQQQNVTTTSNGNAADTTDDVLFTFKLPANSLSSNGKAVEVTAWGQTTSSATNKVAKLWIGPDVQTVGSAVVTTSTTTLITSGNIGNGTAVGVYLYAEIVRVAASSQVVGAFGQTGTTAITFALPASLTKDETVAQYLTFSGSNSTGTANGIYGNNFTVAFNN